MRKHTETIGRCFMFCKVGKREDANEYAGQFDPDIGGLNTFSVPLYGLNAQPSDLPTHYGANTAIDAQLNIDINNTPAATITKYFKDDGYTWESACQDMWLKVITINI